MKISLIGFNSNLCVVNNIWKSVPHFHSFYEVHFVLDGKSEFNYDGKLYTVQKGDVIILPPSSIHNSELDSSNLKHTSFAFTLSKIKNSDALPVFEQYGQAFEKIKNITLLHKSFDKILYEINLLSRGRDLFSAIQTENLLSLLFTELCNALLTFPVISSECAYNSNFDNAVILMKIDRYISTQFSNPKANLKELSTDLGFSEKQTSRFISSLTNSTFSSLLLKQRMNCAKRLIETTSQSFSEIAENVGYNSYSAFFKAFYSFFNKKPTDLRQKIKGG